MADPQPRWWHYTGPDWPVTLAVWLTVVTEPAQVAWVITHGG